MGNLNEESRGNDAGTPGVDMKLEVVVIPVSDAVRAEQFYRTAAFGRRHVRRHY